jgi:hypothetical protein
MFVWEAIRRGVGLPDLVDELNRRMARLKTLLGDTRRDGTTIVFRGAEILPEGGLRLTEMADPDNPPENTAVLYLGVTGGGKSELRIRFQTGAPINLSTEL